MMKYIHKQYLNVLLVINVIYILKPTLLNFKYNTLWFFTFINDNMHSPNVLYCFKINLAIFIHYCDPNQGLNLTGTLAHQCNFFLGFC